jgi:hypothetical protein
MKLNRYLEFINEGIFRKIKKNKNSPSKRDAINKCVADIVNFLEEKGVSNWTSFLKMSPFSKEAIHKLIDGSVNSLQDVKEVNFLIQLELCDRKQLRELISRYETEGEYEKCSLILKKLNEK